MDEKETDRPGPPPRFEGAPDGQLVPQDGPYDHAITGFELTATTRLLPRFLLRYANDNTRESYQQDLVDFFHDWFGPRPVTPKLVERVRDVHVNAYLQQLARRTPESATESDTKPASPATIRRRLSVLRTFFRWCVAKKLIETNPADKELIRLGREIKDGDRQIITLSKRQANRLVKTAGEADRKSAVRDRTLLIVLINLCLRRSEAAAMNVEDLRRSGNYWTLSLHHTKGGGDDFVAVPPFVVDAIHEMQDRYGYEGGALWRSFSNRNRGERLTPQSIHNIVKKAAREAGLGKVGAHMLRHTGCTLALEHGSTILEVQELARHKQIDTTRRYLHNIDKKKNPASSRIGVTGR